MYEYSRAQGGSYTPSLMEFTLTLAIVAFGIFLFKVVAKYLTLFPEAEMQI
jgi:Ni/Fe-hydrogenase subunit HybB-like protein